MKKPNRKEYQRQYYANKTRLRQIEKMKLFMDKYPEEAKKHYDQSH